MDMAFSARDSGKSGPEVTVIPLNPEGSKLGEYAFPL